MIFYLFLAKTKIHFPTFTFSFYTKIKIKQNTQGTILESRFMKQFGQSSSASQTCAVWGDGVQFHSQWVVGLSVVIQSMAVTPAPIKEPLPTKHGPVRQVQPQVFPHLAFLTLPATGIKETAKKKRLELVFLLPRIRIVFS